MLSHVYIARGDMVLRDPINWWLIGATQDMDALGIPIHITLI